MEQLVVNRFKTYRTFRWCRSNYLWQESNNKFLAAYNIKVVDDSNGPADILAIPCPHLPGKEDFAHGDTGLALSVNHRGNLDYYDTPIVCDSSLDYAYLDPALRDLLAYPQVRCFFPNVSFRNSLVQQRQTWGGEYYGHVISEKFFFGGGPSPRLEREALPPHVQRKIKPVNRPPTPPFTDEVFEYIEQRCKPLKSRDLDVVFVGRDTYLKAVNFPTLHRHALTKTKWPDLPGNKLLLTYDNFAGTKKRKKSIKSFKYPYEYVDVLLRSKVVLSPWGWGAWCVRDLEALACGCIVIKPFCGNTLIYPDIYDPKKQFFVWSDVTFDHLTSQLDYCYSHLDELQERVNRGRSFVYDALYPNDKLYCSWTSDLRSFLESALEPQYEMRDYIPSQECVFKPKR